MTEVWYPLIDEEKCNSCGACVEKCMNGVYDKTSQTPQVIYPQGCVDGCRGCQSLCPVNAIAYCGDEETSNCTCGCSSCK